MYINTFTPVMPRSNVCINCKIYIRRKNCANVRISLFLEMYLLFARRREETLSGDSRVLEKKKKKFRDSRRVLFCLRGHGGSQRNLDINIQFTGRH